MTILVSAHQFYIAIATSEHDLLLMNISLF